MKILYVSSVVNHHHIFFVEELNKMFPNEVWYAALETYEQRRKVMNFPDFKKDWIISITENRTLFASLFIEADVVLCQDRNFYPQMKERLKRGKLTFYFSEGWFKNLYGKIRLFSPHILKLWYEFYHMSQYPSFFYLSQSKYAADDFKFMRLCSHRILNFGYSICVQQNNRGKYLLPQGKINVLWCGRMLKCKNVDILVKSFINIAKIRANVHLTIVGQGECEKVVLKLISDHKDFITHRKFLPTDEVRFLMNQADIYVFPSSGREG